MWILFKSLLDPMDDRVHPDSSRQLWDLHPQSRVFNVVSRGPEYWTMRYGDLDFLVKPGGILREVPPPAFQMGDRVKRVGRDVEGTIVDIFWHFKRDRPFFYINSRGRRISRRFEASELEIAQINESRD